MKGFLNNKNYLSKVLKGKRDVYEHMPTDAILGLRHSIEYREIRDSIRTGMYNGEIKGF